MWFTVYELKVICSTFLTYLNSNVIYLFLHYFSKTMVKIFYVVFSKWPTNKKTYRLKLFNCLWFQVHIRDRRFVFFFRMTSKKRIKSKHKKKKGNVENTDDSLRILLQDEALVYCKMENYEKAIRQYTAVSINKFMSAKDFKFLDFKRNKECIGLTKKNVYILFCIFFVCIHNYLLIIFSNIGFHVLIINFV